MKVYKQEFEFKPYLKNYALEHTLKSIEEIDNGKYENIVLETYVPIYKSENIPYHLVLIEKRETEKRYYFISFLKFKDFNRMLKKPKIIGDNAERIMK